jgi:hypothetical protein
MFAIVKADGFGRDVWLESILCIRKGLQYKWALLIGRSTLSDHSCKAYYGEKARPLP